MNFETLRKRSDFKKIHRESNYIGGKYFNILIRLRSNGDKKLRVGIIVSRKVGSAVTRNRIKRVIKEVLKKLDINIREHIDILIISKKEAYAANFWDIKDELEKILKPYSI